MSTAFHFAERNNLDCVTLDGDQVSIFISIICIIIIIIIIITITALYEP
jgi:hypothetical protein